MIIEKTSVFGFEPAIRGMRNPMDSWDKGDSTFYCPNLSIELEKALSVKPGVGDMFSPENPRLGLKDLALASRLVKAGDEHGKFARQICVWSDWTLPRFVWSEADTYKQFVVRVSCSTMHKLGSRHLTKSDFDGEDISVFCLAEINELVDSYRISKTVETLVRLKRKLPEGYLQKATMLFNYQVLRNMYKQRTSHRLPHWNDKEGNTGVSVCGWIKSLPYAEELITVGL